jgi:hypothetical protein
MSTTDLIDTSAPPRDLRLAGIAGWAATVMVFTGVIIISSTGAPEPNFDASADKIQRYLETQDPWAVAVGGFLLAFGLVAWLWFVCGLAAAVRRPGTRPDLLSTVVLVSGTAAVAVMLNGAPQASEYRGGDGLDPQVAQFAFDLTSVTLANMWVALGSLGLASGWAILAGRGEPGVPGRPAWPAWLGWWALAVGAGYLVVRIAFPSPLWYFPHLLFWLWVLVVSTRMLRARPATDATAV